MDGNLLSIPRQLMDRDAVMQVFECNYETCDYGLALTKDDAMELVETRNQALSGYGRIEFGGGILTKLIEVFQNSPYLHQSDYAQTLHGLVETFYYFKNESLDQLSDDELLSYMKNGYDTLCGSLELLQSRELEQMARNIRYGIDEMESIDPELDEEDEDYE